MPIVVSEHFVENECAGQCITPDSTRFGTQLVSSVHRLRWLPVGARQEVKASEPNSNEVWVLVALFGGSIQFGKKSQPT